MAESNEGPLALHVQSSLIATGGSGLRKLKNREDKGKKHEN